jgi:hypothetical protein
MIVKPIQFCNLQRNRREKNGALLFAVSLRFLWDSNVEHCAELICSTRVTVTRIINEVEKVSFLSRKGRKFLFLSESSEQWHYEI